MRRLLLLLMVLLAGGYSAKAQTEVARGPVNPATCDPNRGLLFWNNTTFQMFTCTALNTWSPFAAPGVNIYAGPFSNRPVCNNGPAGGGNLGNGDLYIDTDDANSWKCLGGVWSSIGLPAFPTTPVGVTDVLTYTPTNPAALWSIPGVPGRSVTGASSTDTILATDCSNRVQYTTSVAVAVTLPTPGALQVAFCSMKIVNKTSPSSNVTITPSGGWTINGAASYILSAAASVVLNVDPLNNSNWSIDTSSGSGGTQGDTIFSGPGPWIDIRAYGARPVRPTAIPAIPGINATTNGTTTVTLSGTFCASQINTACFVNGDGVTIYNAGTAHSMTTPTGVAVTPSIAFIGTGTGQVAPVTAGATTYNYKVVALNKNGGFTAASATATTVTGLSGLGYQSANINSCTRTNDVVTCVTASAHPYVVGCNVTTCGEVYTEGFGDASFNGWWSVTAVSDTTHFSWKSGWDTRNGATLSPQGGSTTGIARWFACNHITWNAVTGAFHYAIYSDRANPGTFALIGIGRPQAPTVSGGSDLDNTFDDFGSPMNDHQVFYGFLPTAPPGSAANNNFTSTIVSGAGTTTLVLAAAPTLSTTASILLDTAPAITTAYGVAANQGINGAEGGAIYIPLDANGGEYPINSYVSLVLLTPLRVASIIQNGIMRLYDTIEITQGQKWYGDSPVPQQGIAATSFQIVQTPGSYVMTANPGVYINDIDKVNIRGLSFVGQEPNGNRIIFADGGFDYVIADSTIYTGTALQQDYMGIAFECRGNGSNTGCVNGILQRDTIGAAAPTIPNALVHTPSIFLPFGSKTYIYDSFIANRGIVYLGNVNTNTGSIVVNNTYTQGSGMPFLSVNGASGVTLNGAFVDSGLSATVASFGTPGFTVLNYLAPSSGTISTAYAFQSGLGSFGGFTNFAGNTAYNSSSSVPNKGTSQLLASNIVRTGAFGQDAYALNANNAGLAVNSGYNIFVNALPMASPTCSASPGGTHNVGTFAYRIIPVWQDGGEGSASFISNSCITTLGVNQTINLTWTAAPGNPKNYDIYEDQSPFSGGNLVSIAAGTATSVVFSTQPASQGSVGQLPNAGPTMMNLQGVFTPTLSASGPGGFTNTVSFPVATVNRTSSLPDATGTLVVTPTPVGQFSVYDNFNRASLNPGTAYPTCPSGSCWSTSTSLPNTMSITANQVVGTGGGGSFNGNYWNTPTFSPNQFAEATFVVGVVPMVRFNAANGNGYICGGSNISILNNNLTTSPIQTGGTGGVAATAGQVVRLEVVENSAGNLATLTCYVNGAVTTTGTDPTITSGQPGLFAFSSGQSGDNFHAGNLHPIAVLDQEQDWAQVQHFELPITVGQTNPIAGTLPAGSIITSGNHEMLGTICTNGELALSAGWQSTGSATVTAVKGTGQTCSWTITTGTTTAANPTVTDTLTNPLSTANTVCEMNIHGGTHTAAAGEGFNQTTLSATAPVFTTNFTPTAGGTTYFVTRRCGP